LKKVAKRERGTEVWIVESRKLAVTYSLERKGVELCV
jgi:hypothetical protein